MRVVGCRGIRVCVWIKGYIDRRRLVSIYTPTSYQHPFPSYPSLWARLTYLVDLGGLYHCQLNAFLSPVQTDPFPLDLCQTLYLCLFTSLTMSLYCRSVEVVLTMHLGKGDGSPPTIVDGPDVGGLMHLTLRNRHVRQPTLS